MAQVDTDLEGVRVPKPGSNIEIRHVEENTANDEDKSVIVPASEWWQVLTIRYEYTATATVGTRTIRIAYQDPGLDDIIVMPVNPQTVTASESMIYNGFPGAPNVAATDGANEGTFAIPADVILPPGWSIRFHDSAAIDSGDDNIIHMLVRVLT